MDEEKEGLNKKDQSALQGGAEKLGKQTKRKIQWKKILAFLPIILYLFIGILIVAVLISAISSFLDVFQSKQSKKASTSAVEYANIATDENSSNRIIIDIENRTEDGAYILEYEFEELKGSEEEQLKQIKKDIRDRNDEIDTSKFTKSELKIIAVLMYNGLDVDDYNEEELKALALFMKADIASNSFDLRKSSEIGMQVNMKEIAENDYVYGTLQIHRTKAAEGYDSETPLEYVPYGDENTPGTFCYMNKKADTDIMNKFSIDEEGKAVFATMSKISTNHIYNDAEGNELSANEIAQKIPEENILKNINKTNILTKSFNYKQYISRYVVNYGFLSDLMIITDNVEFCLDIATLAFNGKIVINVKEELTVTDTTKIVTYTQTKLLYDYVTYTISGQKENKNETLEQIATGNSTPTNTNSTLKQCGWSSSLAHTETGENGRTLIYNWEYLDEKYQLKHIDLSTYQHWTLYKRIENITHTNLPEREGTNELINLNQNHITQEYEDYTIDDDYTSQEVFVYTVETSSYSESNTCSYEISEIDGWYLKYHKQYEEPEMKPSSTNSSASVEGQFSKEITEVLTTENQDEINNVQEVKDFINKKEQEYINNSSADKVECVVSSLTVKERVKVDEVENYSSNTKKYKFGEEIADTTEVQLKNVEYVNNQEVFTKDDDEIGFLFIYDKYISQNADLFLENDSEKRLYNQLEEDSSTYQYSNIIKTLLQIYDGIDRGATGLNLKVIDIEGMNTVKGSSTENFIKAWENGDLWAYETGQSTVFPTDYLTEDELYYIVYEDGSSGHNNISYGMATFISDPNYPYEKVIHPEYGEGYYNWKEQFAAEGILVENLYEGAFVDKVVVDSIFKNQVLEFFINEVNNYLDTNLPECKFSRAQKDALIAVNYQYGNITGFKDVYLNALNEDGTIDAEKMREWSRFNYTTTVNDRKYANWLLFTEGLYIDRDGNKIPVGSGSVVEAAYEVADHFMNSGVDVYYAGRSVYGVGHQKDNGIIVSQKIGIQASWDLPIQQPEKYGVVCATFVSMAVWKAGLIDEETINQYEFHGCYGVHQMLTESKYADEWEIINNWDELQEGDIVYMEGHVFIFMEGEKCLDQGYCVKSSEGYDGRGRLSNAAGYRSKFYRGYRYAG